MNSESNLLTGLEQMQAIHDAEIKKLKGIIRGLLIVCDNAADLDNAGRYCPPKETGWYQLAQEVLKQ